MILVVEPVCQFKRRCKRRASSPCAAFSVHQGPAERRQQLHAQALVAGLIELCYCQLGALATFAKQGETYQSWHQSDGERDAESAVAVG